MLSLRLHARLTGVRYFSSDPYHTLGIASGASEKEIKDTYRKLCLKYHPDRNPGDKQAEAEKKFKEVSEAYRVLTEGGGGAGRHYSEQTGSISTGPSGFSRNPFPGDPFGGIPFQGFPGFGGINFEDLFGGHFGATTIKQEIIMKDGRPWKKKITKTSKTAKGTRTEIIDEDI